MENNEQQKELPLYTLYIAGLSNDEVFFYERAAAELKINLKVEFHGCCIDPFIDENGKETTDAEYKGRKYDEHNLISKQYYDDIYGENWLALIKERSKQLILKKQYNQLLEQYNQILKHYNKYEEKSKKKQKTRIYSTIILNIIFFVSLWTIFNIYIGIIACSIFSIISNFFYKRKFNIDDKILTDLRFKMHKNDMSYFESLHK